MKKAATVMTGIFFLLLTTNVFAGDFAADLKDGFKNTVNFVYKTTGNVLGPTLGPAMQNVQRAMYNNYVVRSYNIINGASTTLTGVGIDRHINTAFQFGVLDTYKTSNTISTALTGSGLERYTILLPGPIYLGAEKFRLYLVNYPYANNVTNVNGAKIAPVSTPDDQWLTSFTWAPANGHSAEEAKTKIEEMCYLGGRFDTYYKDWGLYGSQLQCFNWLQDKGILKLKEHSYNPYATFTPGFRVNRSAYRQSI